MIRSRRIRFWSLSSVLLAVVMAAANAENPIFPDGAKLEVVHTRGVKLNSGLTEGPAVASDGRIYFTDMPFGKDNGQILCFDPKTHQTTTFTDKAFKSNGLAFDADGNLISCDGADGGGRCLRRWNLKTGRSEVIAGRYQGKRLNSPNDLCVDRHGRVYFTDPRYGGTEPREINKEAVYRLERDGVVVEITHAPEKPNGIALSPDQRTLYVADHNNGGNRLSPSDPEPKRGAMRILAFPLDENGLVGGASKTLVDFGKENGCDGMRVDSTGNIYLAVRGLARPGILVIDPTGRELAFLPTGPEKQGGLFEDWKGIPSNVEFGIGEEENILYVTIDKTLQRITVKTKGIHSQQSGK